MPTEIPPGRSLRPTAFTTTAALGCALFLGTLVGSCGEEQPAGRNPQGSGMERGPQESATEFQAPSGKLRNIPIEAYTGEQASQGVLDAQKNVDPSNTKWSTETVYEEAKAELAMFLKKIASATLSDEIEQHTTTQFTGTSAWVPSELEVTMDDGTLRVEKGSRFSSERYEREQLDQVSHGLLSSFGWTPEERSEAGVDLKYRTKIFTINEVEGHEDRVITKARVLLDGPTKAGHMLAIEMEWTIEWLVRQSKRNSHVSTQLRAIQLDSFTQIQNHSEPLFADVTGHVFQSVPRFDAEFNTGTGAYHHHIDLMDESIFAGQIGIAVGDVDRDGLEDIFIPQQGGHPNRLLKHMPDGTLLDISAGSGLDLLEGCQSALILDFDNDGKADIALARNSMLVVGYGDGTGKFELIKPVSAGTDNIKSLAAADWDMDGDLDIYACMYSAEGPLGTIPVPYQDAKNGPPNVAWRNTPDKLRPRERWSNVTEELGFGQNNNKFSYSATWEDFDSDGDLDLYVANDFGSNNLYRNDNGHFSDVAHETGAADMAAGMGVSVGDVDSDGDIDIYVTNMWSSAGRRITSQKDNFMPEQSEELKEQFVRHARGNTLLLNDGQGNFIDATESSGAMNGGWAWGAMMVDINNNGRLDIYSPNGFITGKRKDDL